MSTTDISITVRSNKDLPEITLTAILDGAILARIPALTRSITIHAEIDGVTHVDHTFNFVLSGKKTEHTKLDDEQIVDDVLVYIDSVMFDGVNVDAMVHKNSVYIHDHNGQIPQSIHAFHGVMGCNGTVELLFCTPIHLWLLRHI